MTGKNKEQRMIKATYLLVLFLVFCAPTFLYSAAKSVSVEHKYTCKSMHNYYQARALALAALDQEQMHKKQKTSGSCQINSTAPHTYFLLDALLIHCKLATHETLESHKECVRTSLKTAHAEQQARVREAHKPLFDVIAKIRRLAHLFTYVGHTAICLDTEKNLKSFLSKTKEMSWPTDKLTAFNRSIDRLQQKRYELMHSFDVASLRGYTTASSCFLKEVNDALEKERYKVEERKNLVAAFAQDLITKLKSQAEIELFPLHEI